MTMTRPIRLEDLASYRLGGDLDAQNHRVRALSLISFTDFSELTINAAGAITVTQTCHSVDTYADAAADDLETINGGEEVQLLFIHCEAGARVVTVKHGVDNIILQGKRDIILDDVTIGLFLMRIDTGVNVIWVDVTKMAPTVGWEYVDSKILTSPAATVSFDNLSSDYNSFRMTCFLKRSFATASVTMQFNDDTGNNYDHILIKASWTPTSGLARYSGTGGTPCWNCTSPTSWTDLDLGVGPSLVVVEVYNADTEPVNVYFRRNGYTRDYDADAGGAGCLIGLDAGKMGTIVVGTDNDGKCEWKTSAARTMQITYAGNVQPTTKTLAEVDGGNGQPYLPIGIFDTSHFGIAFVYIQNRLATVEKEYMSFAGLGATYFRNFSGRWNNTTELIDKITLGALVGNFQTGSQFILEGAREP